MLADLSLAIPEIFLLSMISIILIVDLFLKDESRSIVSLYLTSIKLINSVEDIIAFIASFSQNHPFQPLREFL